jgi:hypothetical protein
MSATSLPNRSSSFSAISGSTRHSSNSRPAMRVSASLRSTASVTATPSENSKALCPLEAWRSP